MRILITGGTGFIGSHLTRHFVKCGHDVGVVARNTYAHRARALEDIIYDVDLLMGDLAEPSFAVQCARWEPEWVLHLAAETHVDRAIEDPVSFMRSNVMGTTNLLQAFDIEQSEQFPNIIVYSTDEVFGSTPEGAKFDEQTPYNPSNAYSASKVGVEAIARSFVVTHGMPIIVVRPCNTYGPGQHPEKVIPKFVQQILQGEPVTLYNDGNGTRDWLHIDDHIQAINCIIRFGIQGESYNFGRGDEHCDYELPLWIARALGLDVETLKPAVLVPGRPGHDKRYLMDGSKLHALGWNPSVDFAQGIADMVRWEIEHDNWWEHDVIRVRDTFAKTGEPYAVGIA